MKEIVNRLNERRQVERAKELLEREGYIVSKLKESHTWSGWETDKHTGTTMKTYFDNSDNGIGAIIYEPGEYEGIPYDTYHVEIFEIDNGSLGDSITGEDFESENRAIIYAERMVAKYDSERGAQKSYNDLESRLVNELGLEKSSMAVGGGTQVTYYTDGELCILVLDEMDLRTAIRAIG